MAFLSVNVNKVATLRNSRGKDTPNLISMVEKIIALGVKGITVHPRPDERHIKMTDVFAIKKFIKDKNIEFNIEGYPSQKFLNLIGEVRPTQCTLVPDPPETLTSNAGWDLTKNETLLTSVCFELKSLKVRSSLFIDPITFSNTQFESLLRIKPDCVELYTEDFADSYSTDQQKITLEKYNFWSEKIFAQSIKINAGHDLNQSNLTDFLSNNPKVEEISIGHAIFCEALYDGIEKTINTYLTICTSK